jgi:hypothetical protein
MRQLSNNKLIEISNNLDKYFNLATDRDIDNGIAWYKQAHYICKDISNQYNTPIDIVVSILSALSPRNKWNQNIKDTTTLLNAIQNNIPSENIKVCTFHRNKQKAFLLAQGKIKITDKSLKTFNFVRNIADLDESSVTIDVWHLRACFGKTIKTTPTKLAYNQIKELTINKAKEKGLKGFEYQAIIWNSVKNNFKYDR